MNNTLKQLKRITKLKRLTKTFLLTCLLLLIGVTAKATDYVFMYNSGYLAVNTSGNIVYTSDFSPQCVWTCVSSATNLTAASLQNSNTLYWLTTLDGNGTRRWLQASNSNGTAITTSTEAGNAYWRRDNASHLIYRRSNSYYYAYYRASAWRVSNTETSSTTNNGYGSYRATYTTVTSNSPSAQSTSTTSLSVPTIAPLSATLYYNDTETFGASATATTTTNTIPAHTVYTISTNPSTIYYYYDGTAYTSTSDFTQQSTTHPEITYSWTLTGAANDYLSPTSGTGNPITITHSPQTPSDVSSTLSVTATAAGESQTSTSNATVTAKASTVDPSSVSITSNNPMTVYVGNTGNITYTLTPTPCYNNVTFTSANNSIATVSSTGEVTGVATGQTTISVKAYKYSNAAQYVEATVTVNVRNKVATPTIAFEPIGNGETATATITSTTGADIYYTVNGANPTTSSIHYTASFTVNDGDVVRAIAVMTGDPSWDNSEVAIEEYHNCGTNDPSITYVQSGTTATVTITAETGATIYYTTNGSNPNSNSAHGTTTVALTSVADGTTVKAYAKNPGCGKSNTVTQVIVLSGVSGGVVTLNDREPHSWSYYSDASLPAQLHSLSPADVKITYYGNGIMMTGTADYTASSTDFVQYGNANYIGGAKVNVGGEDENTFVYYKTLERGADTDATWTFSAGSQSSAASRCPYKPIPNPFQVRPTYGSTWDGENTATWTGWRGFQCWRLKSVKNGAVYSAASGGSALSTGAVINAETEIYFAPNAEYGMEVELEAVWAIAYVVKANGSGANAIQAKTVGYERNFIVLHSTDSQFNFGGDSGKRITNINYSATVSTYYPEGTQGTNSGSTLRGAGGTNLTLESNTKFENIQFSMDSYTITAANHDVIIGRGCTGTVNNLQGINGGATDLEYMLRVESGTYNTLTFVRDGGSTVSGRYLVKAIMGCDYDRATNTNNKLSVSANSHLFFSRSAGFSGSGNKDQKTFDCVFKSGTYQSDQWDDDQSGTNGYLHIAYLGQNGAGTTYPGVRCVTVEGGDLGGMCGGRGVNNTSNNSNYMTPEVITFDLRIKGGTFHGGVFGGAADNPSIGSRRFIMTGGEIWGWLAGGCNGTGSQDGQGVTNGNSYIYVGGTALVGGNNAMSIQNTNGGQVFGAGRGHIDNGTHRQSSVNYSYVAIADEAVISNDNNGGGNVYGGSYNGIVAEEANVYILGGTVQGSVFGGSYGNTNISGNIPFPKANVTMTGGLVTKGVYGGSNSTGTVENVEMHINGGQVGTSSANANVHGGGYGEPTLVSGNVAVNLGTCNATSGATVYGDVYGGSAMGVVNTDSNNTTTVSLYKGTIYGGLYGGGYGPGGEDADVNGKVAVNVYGGSVLCSANDPDGEAGTGSVFGCNNISGTPKSTVTVDIYGTDQPESGYALHAVYGGGNKAAYTGVPVVTIHGCSNSIEYVYGGGNATDVKGTDVTIWGGNIGNAFGGGNGYSVTGNHTNASAAHYNPGANITSDGTNLTIHGGTIGAAFGGSNQYGTINSTIAVTVKSETESGYDPCSGNAYTECEMNINELYGGGNEAPIQTSGGAWIEPTVTLDCSAKIGMLFGGAKAADYVGDIDLVVKGGTYDKVFGGNNKGGTITGNVKVTFKGGETNAVYGGCNENGTITGTLEVVIDKQTTDNCDLFYVGDVYGGGDMASYEAPDNHTDYPKVTIKNGTINGSVYGGGKGETATVTGNPEVVVGDVDVERYAIVRGNVYGGGNAAEINGHTFVLINNKAKVLSNIYGGGNMARVSGNTKVIVNGRID